MSNGSALKGRQKMVSRNAARFSVVGRENKKEEHQKDSAWKNYNKNVMQFIDI
jgi:hypothetical protein